MHPKWIYRVKDLSSRGPWWWKQDKSVDSCSPRTAGLDQTGNTGTRTSGICDVSQRV